VDSYCSRIAREEADALHKAIQETKIKSPPTNCLVPIGAQQILKGLLKEIKAEFYTAETREPSVYRGNPFQIEVGIAFGGQLPADEPARVIRFANRVPLLYQPSACAITRAVIDTNWRNYGLSQPRNSLPEGPLVVFVHIASVWVPFTSESKEAVAGYDEIMKEISLALMTCGRKLKAYINKRKHIARESQRRHIFERYIGEVVMAVERMTKVDPKKLYEQLQLIAKSRTESADTQFDEDGNVVKEQADTAGEIAENTVVIEANQAEALSAEEPTATEPAPVKTARRSKQLFDDSEAA
jgi:DNA topoisomerase-6 subunit B